MRRNYFNYFNPTIPGMESPPKPRVPRERRAPTNQYRWVREVKGGAFQARVWLGNHRGGSLNLGLFTVAEWESPVDAEWAAGRASRAFDDLYDEGHGLSLRKTLEKLKRDEMIPDHVLPPRVKADREGRYFGRVRLLKANRIVETPSFDDAWAAYDAICSALAREFPRPATRAERREAARQRREALQLRLC